MTTQAENVAALDTSGIRGDDDIAWKAGGLALENLRFRHKLGLIEFLCGASLILVTLAALVLSWQSRLDERKAKLMDLVIAAKGALGTLDSEVTSGYLTRPDAMDESRKLIGAMTFGETDYLFLVSYDGTVLASSNKELVGRNEYDLLDADNHTFVQDQIAVAKTGGGFVRYGFKLGDGAGERPKLSYVEAVPGWSAYLGAGVFIDDLESEFWSRAALFLGIVLAIIVPTFLLSEQITASIVRPIGKLAAAMAELAKGRFDTRIEGVERQDEVGSLARGVEGWKQSVVRREQLQAQIDETRQKLLHVATHDEWTGLPNGMLLVKELETLLHGRQSPSVVIFTIGGLHQILERHGPAAFKEAIQTLSGRLARSSDRLDVIARLGETHFAVVTAHSEPHVLAGDLRDALSRPVQWSSLNLHVSASAGLASAADVEGSAEALLQAAITADRHAGEGIGRYTPELRARIEREEQVERRLRSAVATGKLSVALQPKVRSFDGALLGAEALARWHDDELGSVLPAEFVPMAEKVGIIGDLDDWILRRSLQEAVRWREAGLDLRVAVNVSAIELRNRNLVARIRSAITEAQCDPAQLVVELTESAVAEDPTDAVRQLRALKKLGVALSLDDFGTGYSSLSHLRRFPFDTLKIDRSFVIDLPQDPDACAIARAIVALAQSLGIETVAEGVETEAQSEFLCRLGVDIQQGYLYAEPLSPDEFHAYSISAREARSA